MTGKEVLANTGTLTAIFRIVDAFEKKNYRKNVKDAASEPKLRRYDDTLELVPQVNFFSEASTTSKMAVESNHGSTAFADQFELHVPASAITGSSLLSPLHRRAWISSTVYLRQNTKQGFNTRRFRKTK
ncbi:hypothetical protein B0H14DRAFT_2591654 [Mycena olivaceomarginata]|nr:hypothetical protein B0H14DRAFT_2591654 [Mycena olivaceomarginata]